MYRRQFSEGDNLVTIFILILGFCGTQHESVTKQPTIIMAGENLSNNDHMYPKPVSKLNESMNTNNLQNNPVENLEFDVSNLAEAVKSMKSASKIIIPSMANNTINSVELNKKNTNVSQSKTSVKHPVLHLDENDINKLLTQKTKDEYKYNKPHYNEATGELINSEKEQPCKRNCMEGEEPKICYYKFSLEWYQTMSKACYKCPYNLSDCSRPDCITADGISRPITVVNRKMPGPAIEVCKDDRVIVDVENDLMVEGTTIHWHGQHQRGTPYMDGTPYVTQCPIPPKSTFRYQFNATHPGTHFWHSHSGMQRADGAAGAFIVRVPRSQDPHSSLYDHDKSDHYMIVTDWVHELSMPMFTSHHHSDGNNKPPALLINGVGKFKIFENTTRPLYMKAARFSVERGYKYRFRVINAEFLNCPIELTIDGHNITVISSDGYDLEPITVTSLVTYAGERFDFVLEANNKIDNYWIKFRGLMDCDDRFTKARQVAVLHYEGSSEAEPTGEFTWEQSHNEGLQLNSLNKGEEQNEAVIISTMKSLQGPDESLKITPDYQFYIAYDFYPKNSPYFHKSPHYGYYQVPNDDRVYTPQLNHISMKIPSTPLMLAKPSPENFCNASSIKPSCKTDFCECPHVLSVKKNAIVEVVIVDEGVTFDANHPFHLHGHQFRVVGMRRLGNTTSVEDVKAFDEAGSLKRNLQNAPLKDTITVPDGGYTVIRFKADNPGYWLFHCHIEFHVEIGMALVFKIGEHSEMPPVPPGFPTCGNYVPDNMPENATPAPHKEGMLISVNHWWPIFIFSGSTSNSCTLNPVFCFVILTLCYIFRYVVT